jgi:predicted glycoside hydrolase/deacetylase ChbG (UPF0249 family)
MKLLVPNADDFGLAPAINAAVAQAHTTGILTSVSLLIGAEHAEEAVEFSRSHPSLGVGLHLCLVDGRPVAPAGRIAALTDPTGTLPPNPFALSARLARRPEAKAAVEAELRAQIEKFLATGLRPTHLDTHQHAHLHPSVLRIVARLAREYDIVWVRGPVEPLRLSLRGDGHRKTRTFARWSVFGTFGALRTASPATGIAHHRPCRWCLECRAAIGGISARLPSAAARRSF